MCLRACDRSGKFYGGREMIVWVQRLQGEKSEHMPPVVRILPAVHNTRCKKDGYFSVSTYLSESNMACLFGRKLLVAPFFSSFSVS